MKINTQFPVAVHLLTLIAFSRKGSLTSDMLAESVNTNPVVVRRIMAKLKKSGLIDVKPGVGGAELKRPPNEISLLDISNAVNSSQRREIFDLHKNPNPKCFVGANIHEALNKPLAEAQRAMEESLKSHTLENIMMPIAQKTNRRVP